MTPRRRPARATTAPARPLSILHTVHQGKHMVLAVDHLKHGPGAASSTPCVGCQARCCTMPVRLTLYEALTMTVTLGLRLADVVRVERVSGPTDVSVNLHVGPVELWLRRQPVEDKPCLFLVTIGGRSLCGAYAVRPVVCRIYPFKVIYDQQSIRVGFPVFCPTNWDVSERHAAPMAEAMDLLALARRRSRELAAGWLSARGGPGTLEELEAWAAPRVAAWQGGRWNDPDHALRPPPSFAARLW